MNLQEEQGGETWLSPILVSLGFDSLANRSAPILRLRIFSGIFSTRAREHPSRGYSFFEIAVGLGGDAF